MSPRSNIRRLFPALPRDYIRRRRAVRRITNISLITVLSLATVYFITRPTGGVGFRAPKQVVKPVSPAPLAPDPTAPAAPPTVVSSLADASGYELANGPYSVSDIEDLVLHDAHRNKDLHVRIFYPNDSGKYPVIVFSHGAGGSQNCCEALTHHWATYGFITIQPTHDDSAVQRRNAGEENIRFMQAVRDALKKPALWESRPRDISYVLDALPALDKRIAGLAGKIDPDRIGVTGHSGTNFADARVKAVLCLSPQGPGQFGLNDHSFDQISLPYMGMTGSLDSLGPVASPAWHKAPFDRSQPGDKYHLFIEGANHMSFITAQTLLPARAAQAEAILGYTNSASLAFWDAYLKGNARAKQYLQSDALEKSSHGAVRLSRR